MEDHPGSLEKEVDLRKHFLFLVKRWRLIRDVVIVFVLFTLVTGLGTASANVTSYEATAGVAIVKSKTTVNFEEKIKTVSPDTAASGSGTQDPNIRRTTLASLVQSPLIAREVVRKMGEDLPASLRDPEVLVRMVEGRVRKGTDIVDVIVRGGDPALIPPIANNWAMAFESYVNRVYSGTGLSSASVEQDVTNAKESYNRARDAVLDFARADRSHELQNSIEYRKGLVEALRKSGQSIITTTLAKQTETLTDFITRYQSLALNVTGTPLISAINAQLDRLSAHYADKSKIDRLLIDAYTLREAISKSPYGGASNSLALTLLKAQLVTAGELPGGLQLQVDDLPSGASSAEQLVELDAFISALTTRSKDIQAEIDIQSRDLMRASGSQGENVGILADSINSVTSQVQKLTEDLVKLPGRQGILATMTAESGSTIAEATDRLTLELRQLESELAREQDRKKELAQGYTVAWQGYTTLMAKTYELSVASQLPGSEVVFVLPAMQPTALGGGQFSALFRLLPLSVLLAIILGTTGAAAIGIIWPDAPEVGIRWRSIGKRITATLFPRQWFSRRRKSANLEPPT